MTQDPSETPPPASSARQSSPRHPGRNGAKSPRRNSSAKAGVFSIAVQDINRLREIATVLARHGFHQILRRMGIERILGARFAPPPDAEPIDPSDRRGTARRMRLVLEDLGTTFIKLGQILSTRQDLLPHIYIQEFEKLQDRVPAMPFEDVKNQIERSLRAPLSSLYAEVDPKPLATASIGQVHRARTLEGRDVVVKVQRPGIEAQIRSDLDILYFLSRILKATIEEVEIYNIEEIVQEFDRAIYQEIDFLNEARNIRRFRENHASNPHVAIPEVITDLSSRTVLTLEFLNGHKLSELEKDSPQAERLLEILIEAAYNEIFEFGLFHGDPHPGNILVLGPEKVGFIDFGLVGQLTRAQQDDLITLLITIIHGDVDGIARTVLRMGQPQGRVPLSQFKREIATLRDRYLHNNLNEIDVSAFTTDLMDAAQRYRIKLNSEYALLVKATVTVEGILRRISPSMDLVKTASPMARRLVLERYSSRRILEGALNGAITLSGFLKDVPAQLDQVLMDLESGTISVNVRNPEMDQLGSHLAKLGTRIFLGFVSCGLIMGGSVMLAQLDYRPYDIPLLLFLGAAFLLGAISIGVWALAWPLISARARRIRLGPILSLLRMRSSR